MLGVATFVAALIATVNPAAFTDMSCTNLDPAAPKFLPNATSCDDFYSSTACAQVFGKAVVNEGTVDRDAKCNADANGINTDVRAMAIRSCPKHCGYCCKLIIIDTPTPEFNCKNKLRPRVKCETVTQNQCRDPLWAPILIEDCPKVCGFCLLKGGCVDKVNHCGNDPTICTKVGMQAFVRENCQRTCGLCPSAGTNKICPPDTSTSCTTWARKGFCTNNFYTETQRRKYCATTCNLC